jgi:hypothetical protein
MSVIVPLLVEAVSLAAGGLLVVILFALVVRALAGGEDWSTGRRGGSGGEDVVCPRCHHRTPPDATRCPECGKSL